MLSHSVGRSSPALPLLPPRVPPPSKCPSPASTLPATAARRAPPAPVGRAPPQLRAPGPGAGAAKPAPSPGGRSPNPGALPLPRRGGGGRPPPAPPPLDREMTGEWRGGAGWAARPPARARAGPKEWRRATTLSPRDAWPASAAAPTPPYLHLIARPSPLLFLSSLVFQLVHLRAAPVRAGLLLPGRGQGLLPAIGMGGNPRPARRRPGPRLPGRLHRLPPGRRRGGVGGRPGRRPPDRAGRCVGPGWRGRRRHRPGRRRRRRGQGVQARARARPPCAPPSPPSAPPSLKPARSSPPARTLCGRTTWTNCAPCRTTSPLSPTRKRLPSWRPTWARPWARSSPPSLPAPSPPPPSARSTGPSCGRRGRRSPSRCSARACGRSSCRTSSSSGRWPPWSRLSRCAAWAATRSSSSTSLGRSCWRSWITRRRPATSKTLAATLRATRPSKSRGCGGTCRGRACW